MASRVAPDGAASSRRNPYAQATATTRAPTRARHTHSHSDSSNNEPVRPPPNRFLTGPQLGQRPPSSYIDPAPRTYSYQSHRPPSGRTTSGMNPRIQISGVLPSAGIGRDGGIEIEDEVGDSEEDDIIVRDESGGFGIDEVFGLGGLAGESEEDMDVDGAEDDEARRKASLKLIEKYRSHSRQHIDPRELRLVVQESLLHKVASLEDDKWMYEPEPNADREA